MQIPKTEVSVNPLYDINMALIQYYTFMTAVKHKIFSQLTSPKTSSQVAAKLQTDPHLMETFLDALTAMGFLNKMESKYTNTPLSEIYLVEGEDLYQGDVFEVCGKPLRKSFLQFYEYLKPTVASVTELDEKRWKMNAQSLRAGAIQQMVNLLQSLPGFSEARNALDIRGGLGLFSIAFASASPNLKVTLFEYPHIAEWAQKYIRYHNMENAVEVISGDITKDPIGENYDIVFISECLYFVKKDLTAIFQKVRNSMKENGTLICRHLIMTNEGTAPKWIVLQNLAGKIVGINEYASLLEDEIPSALREAGFFKKIDIRSMEWRSLPYTLHIAQK